MFENKKKLECKVHNVIESSQKNFECDVQIDAGAEFAVRCSDVLEHLISHS